MGAEAPRRPEVGPLPRAEPFVILALCAALFAPSALAGLSVPDAIQGVGAASSFQVFGQGMALEGGVHQWNDVCGFCQIRLTLTAGRVAVAENGGVHELSPGQYELREYRGLFAFSSEGPGAFIVQLHGAGSVVKLG